MPPHTRAWPQSPFHQSSRRDQSRIQKGKVKATLTLPTEPPRILSPTPPSSLTHPSIKSAKRGKNRNRNKTSSHQRGSGGGGEGEEGRRLRSNGSAPAACTRLSGRARARRRVDLAARIKLQCKDYAAVAAWRPQLTGASGTARLDAGFALLPQSREGRRLPTRVRGALGLRAAPLGSDL